jgi:hypothetical protein
MSSTKYIQTHFELKEIPKDVEETRTIPFIINADVKDRHKDVLDYDKWNLANYNANPIVGYQHNVYGDNMCVPPNPDDVLGKGHAELDTYRGKKVLISTVEFEPKDINPTAEKVFRKVLFGSLRAASVGILPIGKIETEYTKNDKGEVTDFTNYWKGQELLEWSIVNIPANQESVRRSMKNHTVAALDFAARILEEFSVKDLRQMKVQEILDAIEKKYPDATPRIEQSLVKNTPVIDPELQKYINRQKLLKNSNGRQG